MAGNTRGLPRGRKPGHVTLDKSLLLSGPQLPICEKGDWLQRASKFPSSPAY